MNSKSQLLLLLFLIATQLLTVCTGQWATFGTLDPDQGFDQARVNAMDDWQQKESSLQLVVTTFDPEEMVSLWSGVLNIWNSNKVPIISWNPWFLQAQGTPSDIEVLIANGEYDDYIIAWSSQLKGFLCGVDEKLNTADDRRVYIRFAPEFNGNWFPWSATAGESLPLDYISMWKRVTDLVMTSNGLSSTQVQWIWSGINQDTGDFKLEDYYPGNDYVDWVGVGGFNWGDNGNNEWYSPVDLFAPILPRLKVLSGGSKPIAITEYATVSDGTSAKNNVWLPSMFDILISNQIKMLVYRNLDKMESQGGEAGMRLRDWSVFGGSNGDENYNFNGRWFKGYSNYRKAVGSNAYFIGSNSSNPQLLDNGFFFGSRDTNPTTDGTTMQPLVVFSDSTTETPDTWGHNGLMASINEVDLTAPEGHNTIQMWTKGWGGFGFFLHPIDISQFDSLEFYLKSTAPVKIEIKDARGRSYPVYQPSTEGVWKSVKIPLSEFTGVNKSKIFGSFIATMEVEGYFAVDNIQYI